MTTTLTERDKKLLYILGLVLVAIVAIRFIVVPSYNKLEEANKTKDSLVQKQEQMMAEIANVETYKKALTNAEADYKKSAEKVYTDSKPAGIDQAITGKISELGLTPTSLNITEINKVKVYQYSIPKTVSESESSSTTNDKIGVVADKSSLVTAANVELSASGSEDSVRAMAMAMSDAEGIHIQSLKLTLAGASSSISATISMIVG